MKAVSLFSSAGIGEYYLKDLNIDVVIANELISKRAITHSLLYNDCEMINGDISDICIQSQIVDCAKKAGVQIVIASPPCQGLSLAGLNKTESALLSDPRNFLVLHALNIVDELLPDYFLIENVPRFQKMLFITDGLYYLSLHELLKKKYSKHYNIDLGIFNAADYGVPQTRFRVVYRMWKKGLKWELPEKQKQISLKKAIGDLPSLEAGMTSKIPNHYARIHPANHVLCMKHTPTGCSAFANEIYYPRKDNGERIKGYNNCYKRMRWEVPTPTITMRNEIISSQENVHPGRPLRNGLWSDARILTLRELLIVSSLPCEMEIPINLTETAFRQLIGEGIPPMLLKNIMKGIDAIN